MNNNELNDKLKEIDTENFIWIIYIGIIILSWYANSLEKKYYIFNDNTAKDKYREINIFVFSILFLIYLYFTITNYDDIKKLNKNDSDKKKFLTYYSFIGTVLVLISGFIFLSIAITDKNLDTEIAFN